MFLVVILGCFRASAFFMACMGVSAFLSLMCLLLLLRLWSRGGYVVIVRPRHSCALGEFWGLRFSGPGTGFMSRGGVWIFHVLYWGIRASGRP